MSTKKAATHTRKAALVLPSYSLRGVKTGDVLYIQCISELYAKPDIDQKTGEQKTDKQGKPGMMHLVQVNDLHSGEKGEMVVPIVIYKALSSLDKIVGRCFEMVKGAAEANKATKWELYEVEGGE